jgi:hypothetical protein
MTNRAQIDYRTAYLSTDFGEEIARKWFGDESVNSLPRYTRGPRKGKIKGAVSWSKVVRGGWVSAGRETADGNYSGYVERRVGRIFDRKLHELVSDRFGTHVGDTIRDLDLEERQEEARRSINIRIDQDMRKIEMNRMLIEHAILSGMFEDNTAVFQDLIAELNEDIAALCLQYK